MVGVCRCGFQLLRAKGWYLWHLRYPASAMLPFPSQHKRSSRRKCDRHPFDLLAALTVLCPAVSAWLNSPASALGREELRVETGGSLLSPGTNTLISVLSVLSYAGRSVAEGFLIGQSKLMVIILSHV